MVSSSKTVDAPVELLGLEFQELTPHKVTAKLRVTRDCCQPFKKLHGGVSALITESLASVGAHMASGFGRIAGVHLSINHFKSADLGDLVFAEAVPVGGGNRLQVWEATLWKISSNAGGNSAVADSEFSGKGMQPHCGSVDSWEGTADGKVVVSSARVTILCNMPVPENAKDAGNNLKKLAKL